MSNTLLVIGESGSGKSSALKTLDAEKTALIQMKKKDLPWGGWKKDYHAYNPQTKQGNLFVMQEVKDQTSFASLAKRALDVCRELPQKYIILDDFQYLMAFEFMKRAKERGYDKFTEMAQNVFNVIQHCETLRDDQTVVILCHSEDLYTEGAKKTKMKTIGKMLDDKITLEGLFTVVFLTEIEKTQEGLKYWFVTKSDGSSTAKSPDGMFPMKIPNDMKYALERMEEFYAEG